MYENYGYCLTGQTIRLPDYGLFPTSISSLGDCQDVRLVGG
jgi:hypothetical protein